MVKKIKCSIHRVKKENPKLLGRKCVSEKNSEIAVEFVVPTSTFSTTNKNQEIVEHKAKKVGNAFFLIYGFG